MSKLALLTSDHRGNVIVLRFKIGLLLQEILSSDAPCPSTLLLFRLYRYSRIYVCILNYSIQGDANYTKLSQLVCRVVARACRIMLKRFLFLQLYCLNKQPCTVTSDFTPTRAQEVGQR